MLTRKHRAPYNISKRIGEWNSGMYTYGVVVPFFSLCGSKMNSILCLGVCNWHLILPSGLSFTCIQLEPCLNASSFLYLNFPSFFNFFLTYILNYRLDCQSFIVFTGIVIFIMYRCYLIARPQLLLNWIVCTCMHQNNRWTDNKAILIKRDNL